MRLLDSPWLTRLALNPLMLVLEAIIGGVAFGVGVERGSRVLIVAATVWLLFTILNATRAAVREGQR